MSGNLAKRPAVILNAQTFKKLIGKVAMIGGIFETIGKTLGIGKEKYYLELDDAAEQGVENLKEAATKATKVAKAAAVEVVDKAQEIAETVTDEAADKAKATAAKGKEKAKEVSADAAQAGKKAANKVEGKTEAAGKAAKNAAKKGKKAAKSAASATAEKAPEPKVAPEPEKPAAPTAEEIIAKAIAGTNHKTNDDGRAADAPDTFSTDYLMPLGNRSRRRPGPSFGKFKGMAKDVNPRLKN